MTKSEYIVKIFDVFKNNNSINILMEYADDGTLYNKILTHKSMHRKFNFEELNFATKSINHSEVCRFISYGAGLFNPITFFTPLANHSSCLIIETIISAINNVAIAR